MRAAAPPPVPGLRAVAAWATYDLANTIFSANIVSTYFSVWVVRVMGGSDRLYGNAAALSMLLILVSAPTLGALSDRAGRRMPFLVASTLVCVGLTALLGTWGLMVSLAVFVFANAAFQAGLIFYDALLPVVSTPANRGRIGGIGVAVGYIGSFIGVGSGLLLLDRIGYTGMFRLTAGLFLVFALPCFVLVREPRATPRPSPAAGGRAATQVVATLAKVRRYPGLGRFLLGRFCYTDPANTIIVFMTIYLTEELGFGMRPAQLLMLVAIGWAVAGGVVWGRVADGIGPRRGLEAVLAMWLVALAGIIAASRPEAPAATVWLAGGLAGACLGGLWACDRPLMIRLAPPRFLGEMYGAYAMVGRFAAVVGPLLWGLVVDRCQAAGGWLPGLGCRPTAVASLMALMALGWVLVRGVDDAERPWPPELS